MDDAPEPETSEGAHTALATGAAAVALVSGTIAILVALGFVLKAFGYGVMLLVAMGGLLIFGAVYDLRRKRQAKHAQAPNDRSG